MLMEGSVWKGGFLDPVGQGVGGDSRDLWMGLDDCGLSGGTA